MFSSSVSLVRWFLWLELIALALTAPMWPLLVTFLSAAKVPIGATAASALLAGAIGCMSRSRVQLVCCSAVVPVLWISTSTRAGQFRLPKCELLAFQLDPCSFCLAIGSGRRLLLLRESSTVLPELRLIVSRTQVFLVLSWCVLTV